MYIWCLLSCAFSEISLFMAQYRHCTCSFLGSKLKLNKPSNTYMSTQLKVEGSFLHDVQNPSEDTGYCGHLFFISAPHTDQTCIVELYKFSMERYPC